MSFDRERAERAVFDFLRALGRDPESDPDLQGTPARVVDAYRNELLSGYEVDVPRLFAEGGAVSRQPTSGWVVLSGIALSTVCPHHLLISHGSATVAYRPGERLYGLGTLSSVVHAYSRRLALQESIGEDVVEALTTHGGAEAAYCEIRLRHGCLVGRGGREVNSELVTSARRGDFDGAELARVLSRPPAAP